MTDEPAQSGRARRRPTARRTSLFAHGEPMVWLTGGSLAIALLMIAGLLTLIVVRGMATFWPGPLVRVVDPEGQARMGEVTADEQYVPEESVLDALPPAEAERARSELAREGTVRRRLFRTGNFDLSGQHFEWIPQFEVASEDAPAWGVVVERLAWGRFYGTPQRFELDGEVVAEGPEATWAAYGTHHETVRDRWRRQREIETHEVSKINKLLERGRLAVRRVQLDHGAESPQAAEAQRAYEADEAELRGQLEGLGAEIDSIRSVNDRYQIVFTTAGGQEKAIGLADIVRAYPANQLELTDKLGVYASRTAEFLLDEPREANSEGGVFPAIFGTVLMTLLMSIIVVPFGVVAALYLREYARPGLIVSTVRIAINNLAGVPSIVFGVFGLGFFCYIVGSNIDELLFSERLPNPTYGKSGLLWASLTLALLTLPVVIVPTEEALAAVPGSMREGSYACGATKWQTIRRIVLPRALPGIMTGLILALARGAGEVAPLMLVGAVKLAPELAIDGVAPFIHPERSFMHLGFHIFDLGFKSQNSEAAKPMVFTTTLLLIAIVVLLNVAAFWLRARLRRQFEGSSA